MWWMWRLTTRAMLSKHEISFLNKEAGRYDTKRNCWLLLHMHTWRSVMEVIWGWTPASNTWLVFAFRNGLLQINKLLWMDCSGLIKCPLWFLVHRWLCLSGDWMNFLVALTLMMMLNLMQVCTILTVGHNASCWYIYRQCYLSTSCFCMMLCFLLSASYTSHDSFILLLSALRVLCTIFVLQSKILSFKIFGANYNLHSIQRLWSICLCDS